MYDLYKDLGYGQYIWNGVLSDLQEYVSNIPDGETLDIARCRFDPACISVINQNNGRIKIINSQEEDLNYILQRNYNIETRTDKPVKEHIKGEFYDRNGYRLADFLLELKGKPKDVVWYVSREAAYGQYGKNYAMVFFGCLLQFPKRLFDFSNLMKYVPDIQSFISIDMYFMSDNIQLCFGNSAYTTHKFINKDGDVDVNGIGVVPIDKAMNRYFALPGWFGTENIMKDSRSEVLKKIWESVRLVSQIPLTEEPTTMSGLIAKYGGY